MDPNPSWIQIINALIQIDEKKLAHHIALKYGMCACIQLQVSGILSMVTLCIVS